MKIKEFGIVLTQSFRAMAYLQRLVKNRIYPNFAIIIIGRNKNFLNSINNENKLNFFDKFENFAVVLNKFKILFEEVEAEDCNNKKVINAIKRRGEKYFIYTGGGILKEGILNLGKKFIHVHPGIVPRYRGSTCIYYSIINEDECGATCFFMSKKIDEGDIIATKTFKKPNTASIDYEYDCHIRSELLMDAIRKYIKNGMFRKKRQNPSEGETYFIIHPVLKHLAILSCIKDTRNHRNPTTLDYRPEFARPSGSGRISRMPKIENSSAKRETLDFTSLYPEFSIFVHNSKI